MEIYVKDGKALSLDDKYLTPASSSETWVWNEEITSLPQLADVDINFVSGGQSFVHILCSSDIQYFFDSEVPIIVYSDTWQDNIYRTITFTQPVTDAVLLEWLRINAIKQ